MLVRFQLAAMTTPNLGQQKSIFLGLHLILISEEVDLLVDCSYPLVFDGWVQDGFVDAAKSG